MEINDLIYKHAQEQQQLLQRQAAERLALEKKIEQVRRRLQITQSTLERRKIEIEELSPLERELSKLPTRHRSEMDSLKYRQSAELSKIKAEIEREQLKIKAGIEREQLIRNLSSMVIRLLEEAAQMARLEKSRSRSISHEEEEGWLFRRKKTVYISDDINVPLEVTQTEPGNWVVGGKSPEGCIVVYSVSLDSDGKHFVVSAESDASRHSSSYSRRIIGVSDMEGPTVRTRDLSEAALADALLEVMKGVREVCPCHMDCPCDCTYTPTACDACHT